MFTSFKTDSVKSHKLSKVIKGSYKGLPLVMVAREIPPSTPTQASITYFTIWPVDGNYSPENVSKFLSLAHMLRRKMQSADLETELSFYLIYERWDKTEIQITIPTVQIKGLGV